MNRFLAKVPTRFTRFFSKGPAPIVSALLVVVLLLGSTAAYAFTGPAGILPGATRVSQTAELPELFRDDYLQRDDADNDGIGDTFENYVYGTDPSNWNSSGTGVPDGWLVKYGYDPLNPATRTARVASPPPDTLPDAYDGAWPERFRMTLFDYYKKAEPADYVPGESTPWWLGREQANPAKWDAPSGLPVSWLVYYGLDALDADIGDAPAPGGESPLTVREAFEHNTNPLLADSDGDGLDDVDEINVHGTDPSRFSTAGTGLPDGWALEHGLDPERAATAREDADKDGLSNLDEFLASRALFPADYERDGVRFLFDNGLDPLDWQTSGSGIPDGWYVAFGLDPLNAAEADRVLQRASEFEDARWLQDAPPGLDPLPDLEMTVRDAYAYKRPPEWDETKDGVWWGGTNPAETDSDGDGLPDAVEIRGWFTNVTFDLGPQAESEWLVVHGNPTSADTDGDGLTDAEEYRGRATCDEDDTRTFPATDPENKDTAFSGLTDLEKVCGAVRDGATYDFGTAGRAGLDPTRADSAGDYMRDGLKLDYWHARYERYQTSLQYEFPDSRYATVTDWTSEYSRFDGVAEEDLPALFRPDGDVDGDGVLNLLDQDPSGGLVAPDPNDLTVVLLQQGLQIDPALYRFSEYKSDFPRPPTDPANPDTDGDALPDWWEIKYGVFVPELGGWNLDPQKVASLGDGVPDGERNDDGDVIEWFAYDVAPDGTTALSTEDVPNRPFNYDNRQEFEYGTDPNRLSTADDGVPDGWKVFWGLLYPQQAETGSAGDLTPEQARAVRTPLGIQPLSDLTGRGNPVKSFNYTRLVNAGNTPCNDLDEWLAANRVLARGEVHDSFGNDCRVNPIDSTERLSVARVRGTLTLTFADEAELGTNPYFADTDGDGAPDAYEAYYAATTTTGKPDPVVPEIDEDADDDRLVIANPDPLVDTEAVHGTDPARADTDLDGIPDGTEVQAGLGPLDSTDWDQFTDADSDGDGLRDTQEILGWGANVYGRSVQTSRENPDSDGDGLLDYGRVRAADGTERPVELDPSDDEDDARIREWKARGIAWCAAPYACGPGDGRIRFLGERTGGAEGDVSHPLELDTSGDGVPDGWKEYYGQIGVYSRAPGEVDDDVLPLYERARPDWWDEARHGLWWWGAQPGQANDPDLDNDGLNDLNGEDPFPSTSANVYSFNVTDTRTVSYTSPRDARGFIESGFDAADVRKRAQAFGEDAGHPLNARNVASSIIRPRAATEIINVSVDGVSDPFSGFDVQKGRDIVITGRLVLAEQRGDTFLNGDTADDRKGVPNATVVVSAFGRRADTALGLAVTNATGGFRVVANITTFHSATVPEGIVAMGAVGGSVSWSLEPDAIQVSDKTAGVPNTLVVWSYNSSSPPVPGSPYAEYAYVTSAKTSDGSDVIAHAIASARTDPMPITVTSDTRFEFDVEPVQVNGDVLRGTIRLVDAAGVPLGNRNVTLEWSGAGETPRVIGLPPVRVFTDEEGVLNLTTLDVPVGVMSPGPRALVARFTPTAADPFLNPGSTIESIPVRNPTALTMDVDGSDFTVGSTITITGTLTTRAFDVPNGPTVPARPIANAPVRLQIGSMQTEAQTDADGRYEGQLTIPEDVSAGENLVRVTFPGTEDHAAHPAVAERVTVKRTAFVDDLRAREGPRWSTITIQGVLRDANGNDGVTNRPLAITAAGVSLGSTITGQGGVFNVQLTIPHSLPLGVHDYRVEFTGDSAYGPAAGASRLKVVSGVNITLDEDADALTAVRGRGFTVSGRVVDDAARGVPGQALVVSWRGTVVTSVVTNADGRFTIPLPVDPEERLGPASLALTFEPPRTSVYERASRDAQVTVLAATTLTLPDRAVTRGPVEVAGTLLDDRGNALPGALVTFTWNGEPVGSARSTRNGSFAFQYAVPDAVSVGSVPVTATFVPGDATRTYAPSNATATYAITGATRLEIEHAAPLVRGDDFNFTAVLAQDNGAPVPGSVTVTLGDVDLGTATPTGTRVEFRARVPTDFPRGGTTLRVAYEGTEFLTPVVLEVPVSVKVRPRVEADLPRVALQGLAVTGEITLTDDRGDPLRNQSFIYMEAGTGQPLLASTDSDGRAVIAGVAQSGGSAFRVNVKSGEDVLPVEYTTESVRVLGPATPLSLALIGLLVLAVAAVGAFAFLYARWRRKQLKDVRKILDDTIEELLAGNEYVGTVFLAYKRLSAHLSSYGFVEKDEDTAREFSLAVRKAVPVKADALRLLISLFEEARYSDHTIGPDERDRAIRHLQVVRDDVTRLLGDEPTKTKNEVTPA